MNGKLRVSTQNQNSMILQNESVIPITDFLEHILFEEACAWRRIRDNLNRAA